jgi:hypothetical protein
MSPYIFETLIREQIKRANRNKNTHKDKQWLTKKGNVPQA